MSDALKALDAIHSCQAKECKEYFENYLSKREDLKKMLKRVVIYALAGTAAIYGGYRFWKYINTQRLARLAKLAGVKA
jgi:hypothetical protein